MKNMIMFIQECIVFRAYLLSARSIFFQTILVIVIDKYAPNLIQVVTELQKAKEEIEKFKEEAHANKVHMLQVVIILFINYI